MVVLKEIIRYTNGACLEATWVERNVTPASGVEGEEGYVAESVQDVNTHCEAFSGAQMDALRARAAQFGTSLADYEDLIAQCEADYVPSPPVPQPPIVVSPRQIRQALTAAGLRAQVEAAIAAGNQDMKDWWEFATLFEENHPLVVGMAQQLGVSEAALHDLFVLASGL